MNTAIDPVCGMQVTTDSVHRHTYAGTDYFFCCAGCLEKFRAAPAQYLHQDRAATVAAVTAGCPDDTCSVESALYTCPMHPEVRQAGPGPCPTCGMALEPLDIPLTAARTEYTCPMHPEIVQDHPGNCPKCGMALEPRTVALEEDTSERDAMTRRFRVKFRHGPAGLHPGHGGGPGTRLAA